MSQLLQSGEMMDLIYSLEQEFAIKITWEDIHEIAYLDGFITKVQATIKHRNKPQR